MVNPTLLLALQAGFLSALSPCCLPLYPAFLSYMSGLSLRGGLATGKRGDKLRLLAHAAFFLLGLSTVFMALGFSASLIGRLLLDYRELVSKAAGLLLIFFGLFLAGVIKNRFFSATRRWQPGAKPAGYLGSALLGIGFAAGWTPCIGPALASIIVLAATDPSASISLMGAYTVGFAFPFLALAWSVGSARRLVRAAPWVNRVSGALLVITGVMLYTGLMPRLTAYLLRVSSWFGGT